MIEGDARWVAYLSLVIAVFLLVTLGTKSKGQAMNRILWLSCVVSLPLMLRSLLNRWRGIGFEATTFQNASANDYVIQIAFSSVVVILATIAWSSSEFRWRTFVWTLPLASATLISLLNSRLGDRIVGFRRESFFFLVALTLILNAAWKEMTGGGPTMRLLSHRYLPWLILGSSSILFSLRIDGLRTDGAWFHVGYFSGVVETVRSGGLLLWDTPSQYGFLNILVASLVPGDSGSESFLIAQSILLLLVSLTVLYAFWATGQSVKPIATGSVFVILLHFADPETIGPQPFPSSSVMRFGPSLCLFALLTSSRSENPKKFIGIGVVAAIGMLWSFESFYYCAFILTGWLFGLSDWKHQVQRARSAARYLIAACLAASGSIFLGYSLHVFLRVGDAPDWSLFYLAASKFAEGFGSLPMDLWGAWWLLLVGLFACLALALVADAEERPGLIAALGALLGWLSYYVGRSHSSNVVAMIPLIFVAVSLPSLRVAQSVRRGAITNGVSCSIGGATEVDRLRAVRVTASFITVFSAVIVASFVADPKLPRVISQFRVISADPPYDPGATVGESLVAPLRSVELESLPVAYVGNLGLLPTLPEDIEAKLSRVDIWLPQPLGLLEEPIPNEVRSQILTRFLDRHPRDGYLLWHRSNSISGRIDEWREAISNTHDCTIVVANDEWELQKCKVRTQ